MQRWMLGVTDYVGSEDQLFTATCSAPGFTTSGGGYLYRVTAGTCELYVAFYFTGDGTVFDVTLTLPFPARAHFAQFTCFANLVGGALVPANCACYADDLLHITLPNGAAWPTGQVYVQFSGRYRT